MRNIQIVWLDPDDRIHANYVSTRLDTDASAQVQLGGGHGLTLAAQHPDTLRRLARACDEAAVLLTAELHVRETAAPVPA